MGKVKSVGSYTGWGLNWSELIACIIVARSQLKLTTSCWKQKWYTSGWNALVFCGVLCVVATLFYINKYSTLKLWSKEWNMFLNLCEPVSDWYVHVSTLKQNFTNEKYLRYDSVHSVWKITAVNLYDCKNNYSTVSLIWLVWDWTGAEILNSSDCRPLPIQVICCYCSYTRAVKLIRGVFHFNISFICWFWVMRVLCCVFWSLHSWISWWSRKKWDQELPQWLMDWHFWRPFQHFPEICLFHSWSFLW